MAKPWQRPRNTQSDDHQQQQPKFNRAEYLASQNNQKPTVEAEIEETSVVDKVVPKIFPQKEKKFHAPAMSLSDFKKALRDITWVTDVDPATGSFYQLAQAMKAQTDMYYTAYRLGHEYMLAWYDHQVNAIKDKINKSVNIVRDQTLTDVKTKYITGDEEFDTFAERVRQLDFFYEYSDDPVVYRTGKANYENLEEIAKERGGIYLKFFIYYSTSHNKNLNES